MPCCSMDSGKHTYEGNYNLTKVLQWELDIKHDATIDLVPDETDIFVGWL